MKKVVLIFALALMLITTASAAFEYRLDLLSFDPLYKEYDADRSRASLDFQYAAVYDGYPTYIYQGENKFDFVDPEVLRIKPFVAIYHLGETLGLARNTFTFDHWLSPISFDFTFSGS